MSGFDPLAALAALEAEWATREADPSENFRNFRNFRSPDPAIHFFQEPATSTGRTARVIPEDGRATGQPWDADDWREYFDERVAVAMVCGKQSEDEARAVAWRCCITKWLDLHPVASDPSRCAHCGRADTPGNIVPFGTGPHAWLHSGCWRPWFDARRAEAAATLKAMIPGR